MIAPLRSGIAALLRALDDDRLVEVAAPWLTRLFPGPARKERLVQRHREKRAARKAAQTRRHAKRQRPIDLMAPEQRHRVACPACKVGKGVPCLPTCPIWQAIAGAATAPLAADRGLVDVLFEKASQPVPDPGHIVMRALNLASGAHAIGLGSIELPGETVLIDRERVDGPIRRSRVVIRPAASPIATSSSTTSSPAPVRLVVLQVEQLGGEGDRFRCLPFAATITAGNCVERQRAATGGGSKAANTTAGVAARIAANRFARCAKCDLGERVTAQLAGKAAE